MTYFSDWGPKDGPILYRDGPPCIGIFTEPYEVTGRNSVGIAYPNGCVRYKKVSAATFRLVVAKEELDGRWVCDGRQFVQMGDAAGG